MKRAVVYTSVLLLFLASPALVKAGEEKGLETSTDLELQISSLPELRFRLSQSFSFPFLQGQNPLTQDNNIKVVVTADVTPVSLAGIGEIIWTPAAFFMLSGGGQAGSGWDIPLGKGIGINTPVGVKTPGVVRHADIDGKAFDGLIWHIWGAGTFQFDLGALIPGDWTHVVFQTRQEFRYSAYTRAGSDDSWVFENDDAENLNGWKYFATYILGYQMPQSPVLSMVGFMAELQKTLYHIPGGDYWGDGLGYWIFSGMGLFTITPRFTATLAVQMRTRDNYDTTDFANKNDYYYQDMELLDKGGKRRIVFYRFALMLNYKIR